MLAHVFREKSSKINSFNILIFIFKVERGVGVIEEKVAMYL